MNRAAYTIYDLAAESSAAWIRRLRKENDREVLDDPSLDTIEEAADRATTAEIERCGEEEV